ncbi:beta-galactosidase [Martelella alba]|uniref:Beta-galactosidase n=1 Tax=Martelella alba TaxID=2590451 RepID=A0A506U174_9HYPH|nr:beta-galactosidase [Martelella alba]TPW27236.1 beta-galactosidase [Martelella alba]
MLGTCYYPEHWPESMWAGDARKMREMGIEVVRIAEFAWADLETAPGVFAFEWLDRAIATLRSEGLKIVLGTPTAAPPRWLIDLHPEILPIDRDGNPRRFGSRRHYTLAAPAFIAASERITRALAQRYGAAEGVIGWQIDNEFGCDDTIFSWGPLDRADFQRWLQQRYGKIEALNAAWGNHFWSMRLQGFDQVELPVRTVCDINPAAEIDFMRCRSDLFNAYFRDCAQIIRAAAPCHFVTHNFMGFSHTFDHFEMGQAMDLASWDSYPLGRVDSLPFGDDEKQRWANTGHPDVSGMQHDLYRSVGNGRFWIMEQQPGPVNWARWNSVPERGMVRLWTLEAYAHGAEAVVYFRWRQLPQAQEQMHAGLMRPDDVVSAGGLEAARVAAELKTLGPLPPTRQAPVAMIFDYRAAWVTQFQPQGQDFDYRMLTLRWYEAARRLGVDVDIIAPGTALDGYSVVLAPCLPIIDEATSEALQQATGLVILGPRSGSKTDDFAIPSGLPPGELIQAVLPVKVSEVASMRPGLEASVDGAVRGTASHWREWLETKLEPLARFSDGTAALVAEGHLHYLACWPEAGLLESLYRYCFGKAGIATMDLPEHVRIRRRGDLVFAFNYGPEPWNAPVEQSRMLLGDQKIAAWDCACWRTS